MQAWQQAQKTVGKWVRRCKGVILKGAPPEPAEEVQALLKSMKLTNSHLLVMYDTFHWLRSHEEAFEEKVVVDALEVQVDSVLRMVVERRMWIKKLLLSLLELGGCKEGIVMWDDFLWILVKFCSLNRVELAQALFLIIQEDVQREVPDEKKRRNYLTSDDLQDFYHFYESCPFQSFSTTGVDFDKLPMTRYYAPEFAELTNRFTQLINPTLYLQRVIQTFLPSKDFWDRMDRGQAFCRQVSHDFFKMDSGRVYLRGMPPFRESCDMLLPDALGAVPINRKQWVMRTSNRRAGRGLRQVSVWGEQSSPEEIERTIKKKKEEDDLIKLRDRMIQAARKAAETGQPDAPVLAQSAKELVDQVIKCGRGPPATTPTAAQGKQPPLAPGAAKPGAALTNAPTTVPPGGNGPQPAWQEGTTTGGAYPAAVLPTDQPPRPLKAREGPPGSQPAWAPSLGGDGAGAGNAASATGVAGQQLGNSVLVHSPDEWSIIAATYDETGNGPSDVLPPKWMHCATIAPAPQRLRPQAHTIGRRGSSHSRHNVDVSDA